MTPQTAEEMIDALTRSLAGEKRPAPPRRPVGIGSTDIACIAALYDPALAVDLPKNRTAGDVWLNVVHGVELPRNSRMDRGSRVEPVLLECYREHIGSTWRPSLPPDAWWSVTHPKHGWAFCSPDAFDAEQPSRLIEIKSQDVHARPLWGTPGSGEVATRYLYQSAWAMACADVDETHFLVGFGTDDKTTGEFWFTETAPYVVHRDLQLEARLLEYGERFFNDFVRTGRPPPVKPHSNRREWKRLTRSWFK